MVYRELPKRHNGDEHRNCDAIDQLHVGERVDTQVAAGPPASGPPVPIGDPNATAVVPAAWRLVSPDMPDPSTPGDDYRMKMLEPLTWDQQNDAHAGNMVYLNPPELQISGNAEVLSVGACPPIQSGPGRVILGTFEHASNDLVGVKFVGDSTPLQRNCRIVRHILRFAGPAPTSNRHPGFISRAPERAKYYDLLLQNMPRVFDDSTPTGAV
jgi:hypothetical protein